MILGSIGEWIVGNTFPFVVFGAFGKPTASFSFCSQTLKQLPLNSMLQSIYADNQPSVHFRRILAHPGRYARPVFQCIRRLCNGAPGDNIAIRQSWQPARPTNTCLQRQFCLLLGVHGYAHTHPSPHIAPVPIPPAGNKKRIFSECKPPADKSLRQPKGLVCLIFLICSLRTNIVFVTIFFTLVFTFACLSAAYWNLALAYENSTNTGAATKASRLFVVCSSPFSFDFFRPRAPLMSHHIRMLGGKELTGRVCVDRQAAHSHSWPVWPAGGSLRLLCSRRWISPLVSPWAICRVSSRALARNRSRRGVRLFSHPCSWRGDEVNDKGEGIKK